MSPGALNVYRGKVCVSPDDKGVSMQDKIRSFIIDNFMFGKGKLRDDDSLFDSGIIDSLGFIKLLVFIEKEFNISLDMGEITIENFSTINNIVDTLKEMQ